MLKRSTSRLVAAAAAAGTICALGAATAAAASPASPWSKPAGPVPHAFTDAAPALTKVTFGVSPASHTLVAWKGQTAGHILYESSPTPGKHKSWSGRAVVPHAASSSAPSIASYRDPNGREAVLAVWRGRSKSLIHFAQGETEAGHKITWARVGTLPKSIYNTTDAAPAVFFPQHRYVAVVAYRGPFDHIRYIIGTPLRRGFKWSSSHWVSSSAKASSGPAVAEQQTATGHGKIFVFWKGYKTNLISYATTPDPLNPAKELPFTPVTALTGSVTSSTPAASTTGPHGTGTFLLAYKAAHRAHVEYRTLSGGTWSGVRQVPFTVTTYGPALTGNLLGTTSGAASGNIFLHFFN